MSKKLFGMVFAAAMCCTSLQAQQPAPQPAQTPAPQQPAQTPAAQKPAGQQPAAGTRTALPGPAPGLASGKEITATCQTATALRKRG